MAAFRRSIGVDGEHIRGTYPGILLTAVAKDGNNNIFPIAWAVVETESADTWTWFLALLVDDINSVIDKDTEITFMSDRQKVSPFLLTYKTRYILSWNIIFTQKCLCAGFDRCIEKCCPTGRS